VLAVQGSVVLAGSPGHNKRIKVIRFAHSTVQALRTCTALYAQRYANQVGMMLRDPTSLE